MNDDSGYDSHKLTEYASHLAIFFVEDKIILHATSHEPMLPLQETLAQLNAQIESAYFCNPVVIIKCQITQDEEALLKMQLKISAFRPFLAHTQPQLQMLTLKAYHWLNWDRQSRYCGQCGSLLKNQFTVTEKTCAQCSVSFFPRFSPAVMVVVRRANEILLARSSHFKLGVYSAIAGFVDVGETAEMAAHREVKEETGIEIDNLRYFSTQTWPFPDSFMLAFKANYVSGELKVDINELEDARWFRVDALPMLPTRPSISRMLIDSAVAEID